MILLCAVSDDTDASPLEDARQGPNSGKQGLRGCMALRKLHRKPAILLYGADLC